MEFKEGLTFDDVLLVPKFSDITSRTQTDLKTKLSRNISLNIPFISANMDTVTESRMAVVMAREGGIGIIHRFLTIEEEVKEVLKVKRSGSIMIENPYSIGPDKTVSDAIKYANEQKVSGLLVTDSESKLVGILTNRDLKFETDKLKLVKDVMTKDVVTGKPGISHAEAKEILHKNRIEKLPLVDDSNHVKGLITSKDISNIENFPAASKDKKGRPLVGAAVGVKGDFMERTEAFFGDKFDFFFVDFFFWLSGNTSKNIYHI